MDNSQKPALKKTAYIYFSISLVSFICYMLIRIYAPDSNIIDFLKGFFIGVSIPTFFYSIYKQVSAFTKNYQQ
jgi:hypothetical protein